MKRAAVRSICMLAECALAVACGSSSSPSPAPAGACAAYPALFVASDYTSSAVGAFTLDGTAPRSSEGADLGGDPALSVSTSAHRAFYVARREDTIFELDSCGKPIAKWSTADPSHPGTSNPQDVAVAADGSLWVARYNVASIVVLPPNGAPARTIDLSAFDADRNPNASAVRIAGGKAFLTLERLDDADGLKSKQPSKLLRIDVVSGAIEADIDLAGRNPFGVVDQDGALWLSEPGNFASTVEPFAGVERFDIATSTSRLVVHEQDLGGSVAEVAVTGGCAAAIVADASSDNATSLVTFDPETGAVLVPAARALLSTPKFSLQAMAWIREASGARVLLVGDRGERAANGYAVHAFDLSGACELTRRPDVVFLPQKPVAIRARP